jgi:hypothetical protein
MDLELSLGSPKKVDANNGDAKLSSSVLQITKANENRA